MAEKVRLTLRKSTIGANKKHKKIVESLGLRKINQSIDLPVNDSTKGVIAHIKEFVEVEEI